MIATDIRERLQREPFQTFRVSLTSGRHHDVVNPDLVVLMKSQVFIAFSDRDRWVIVPYLHIALVEAVVNGSEKTSRRKRRK